MLYNSKETDAKDLLRQGYVFTNPYDADVWTYEVRKVLLVGRHATGEISEGVEVVGQEAPTFSTDLNTCIEQIRTLAARAIDLGAKSLLFQNTPGIVTAALRQALRGFMDDNLLTTEVFGVEIGIIISVQGQGERKADVRTEFVVPLHLIEQTMAAVKAANGRAKVEIVPDSVGWSNDAYGHALESVTLAVTVDPVTEFVFSHIEWL